MLAPNAWLRPLVVPQGSHEQAEASQLTDCECACVHGRPARISWARLLKRVLEIDMERGPNCGGQLKIIAAILDAAAIERVLTHLGLQARAPPLATARGNGQEAA